MESNQLQIASRFLEMKISSLIEKEYKTPRLYETWNWEGDVSVLPNKWMELVKQSNLIQQFESDKIKEYLKEKYYNDLNFDKKSFYFITHRSEVAGCVYLNFDKSDNSYKVEFLLVNLKKHNNKGVEEGLMALVLRRINEKLEEDVNLKLIEKISVDLSTSNITENKLKEIGFI